MANTPVQKNQSDVVAKDNVVDMSIFAADAGMGNKEINQESLSIPFLKTNLSKSFRHIFRKNNFPPT